MSKPKIGIIVGSTRATRFADKPTEWIAKIAAEYTDIAFEVVDLRDYPMPFFEEAASPAWAPSQNEVARRWQKKIDELGATLIPGTPAEFGKQIEQAIARYQRVAELANIKAQ